MSVPHVALTWVTTARGGAEKSVPVLADHLARMGVAVDLVWWRHGGPPLPSAGRARVHEVDNWYDYQTAVTRVTQTCAGRVPTVVISNHRTAAADLYLAPHAAVVPVLRHIVLPDQILRVIDPDNGAMVDRRIGEMPWDTLTHAAMWVGISQASAASLRRCAPPGTKVVAIPNGVEIPDTPPVPMRPRTGRLLLAVVARTVPWKRVDQLVRAVADPRLTTSVRLDVFGEAGSHDSELRELADRIGAPVRFCGYTDDLAQALAGCDALVCAALQEGFGRGIIDAAGAGIPAIVPNIGSGPEIVLDGLTGLTYDPHEPGGLVAAIYTALTERERLTAMGRAARALAEAWYTPGRSAAQYLDLVMRQQHPRPIEVAR